MGLELDEALVNLLSTLVYVETLVTLLDVFFNVCLHSFPSVSSLDLLVGFISPKMSSSGGVIVTG